MRVRTPITYSLVIVMSGFFFLSITQPAHAETVTLYTQPDDSGEMLSQQPTFQETWIASASLGNLFLGKDRLTLTFTMKDPNASDRYGQPAGVALGTCPTCRNLQKYFFTAADRALLSDGAFHTFTAQTGTTTLGTADGEIPIYITFFGLSQYHNSTHMKSDAAGTIPFLRIEAASLPTLPPVPQAPEGAVTVYEQSDKSGVMTNPQATYQTARIDSASLGNLNLGQDKLYFTFTMKDPMVNNAYRQPEGVAIGTCSGCRNLQTYYFTAADRALLSDQAFHTFMVETGTTTSTYADGTRPVFISFFNLSQYQYGTKVKSNAAETIPFLKIQKPPPPDPCAAPGACASSVLFLPGIEASRLYRPDYAGGTSKLWEPGGDADVRDLFMSASGESIRDDIYTRDVVDEAYGTFNIYKSFLADLGEWKSSGVINDYRAAPYDWRVSLDDLLNYGNRFPDGRLYYSGVHAATSTPYIIQELRRLAAGSKTGKVTIVAHSNGGLVAKALVKRLEDTHDPLLAKIDSLVMVAVPQTGTPQAIGALLHGYEQGLPRDWLSIFLTPALARAFVANLPSAYNLLPSADYFTYIDDPVVEFDDSDFLAEFRARYGSSIHDGAQLRNFITDARRLASSSPTDLSYPSVGNAALLSRAEAFHTTADAWTPPPSIALHEVAGWGEGTLATIRYYEGKKTVCADLSASTCPYYTTAPTLLYEPIEVVEGDGTVLVPSALWTTASTTRKYWVNLSEYDSRIRLERKHADILEVPSLRTLVQNILTNSTSTTPLSFITTTQPATDAVIEDRLRFILHSPLNLSATDNLGNMTNSATSTIPGGRWKRYGEVQTLTVPKGAPVTLALDGIATGSFTLDMQEISGDSSVVASSTLSAVPTATSTRATMTLADGTLQGASPLRVDYDGDGDTDFSLRPEVGQTTVFDLTPPEARISFSTSTQKLSIEGIDETSPATVFTTATSSLITDKAGNTLQIIFKKLKQSKRELKLEIQALLYNGISAGMAARNALQYEWSADKAGNIRELEQEARAGSSEAEAHYSAKKNTTRIEEDNKGEDDESEKTLPGLVIIKLTTDKGKVGLNY